MDVFLSGDQDVPDGFDQWAGVAYSGPRLEIESRLANFNFRPFLYGNCLAYDSLAEWRDITENLSEYYSSVIKPTITSAVRRGECEHYLPDYEEEAVDKGKVNWRAIGYGRQVFRSDFISESSEQAVELTPALETLASRLTATLRSMSNEEVTATINDSEIGLNKSKGAPFFQASSNIEAGLALSLLPHKLKSFDRVNDALQSLSGGIKMRMHMLERIQGSRKLTACRTVLGGRVVAIGHAMLPKVRTVKAPPFVHNGTVAWFFDLVKGLMMRTWPNWHPLQPKAAAALMGSYRHSFSSDMSTFDDTISAETLQRIRELIFKPLLNDMVNRGIIGSWRAKYLLDYDDSVVNGEILCPARTRDEVACVLQMRGGVKSGERGTTVKDILVAAARTSSILKRLSRDARDTFICWGDDVVVLTDDPTLYKRWEAAKYHRHLFVEKTAPGAVFLMKVGGSGHGLIMRYAYRRINMEIREEPDNPIQAALTLRASYDALSDPTFVLRPHPAHMHYFPMLRHCIPRLRREIALAERYSYRDLAAIYMRSRTDVGDKRHYAWNELREAHLRGLLSDDDYAALRDDDNISQSLATVTKRLLPGTVLKARIRDEDVRLMADRVSTEEVLRACHR